MIALSLASFNALANGPQAREQEDHRERYTGRFASRLSRAISAGAVMGRTGSQAPDEQRQADDHADAAEDEVSHGFCIGRSAARLKAGPFQEQLRGKLGWPVSDCPEFNCFTNNTLKRPRDRY